jgi:methylated-DNA-[protein]-cysteine S-methyltransferase
MRAKPPETFGLDRLRTPIGTALLVSDADGVLRALDWEDYEPRMRALLRRQYGTVVLKAARAPAGPGCAGGLFQVIIAWAIVARRRPFRAGLERVAKFASATELRRAGGETQHAQDGARGRARQQRQSLGVVVPCHRLIGANGALIKYGGGIERKRWLLEHEGVVLGAPSGLQIRLTPRASRPRLRWRAGGSTRS